MAKKKASVSKKDKKKTSVSKTKKASGKAAKKKAQGASKAGKKTVKKKAEGTKKAAVKKSTVEKKSGKKATKKKSSKDELSEDHLKRWQALRQKTTAEAVPYSMRKQFEPKTPIEHKVLGWGYILDIKNDRLEVLFESGIKYLISNYKG